MNFLGDCTRSNPLATPSMEPALVHFIDSGVLDDWVGVSDQVICACALALVLGASVATAALPEPPPVPHRDIKPRANPPAGVVLQLTNNAAWATLFLPEGWRVPTDGQSSIVVHFHAIARFTIQEHLRRCSTLPLLNFALGEGSATHAKPFEYPLVRRADLRRFHVWGCAGTNAQAHLTHVCHLADLWRALGAVSASP